MSPQASSDGPDGNRTQLVELRAQVPKCQWRLDRHAERTPVGGRGRLFCLGRGHHGRRTARLRDDLPVGVDPEPGSMDGAK
jgi:hypothetical protein